jgi:hypothetical protein
MGRIAFPGQPWPKKVEPMSTEKGLPVISGIAGSVKQEDCEPDPCGQKGRPYLQITRAKMG